MIFTKPIPSIARSRGITVIEILMVVSLVAILISFAIPSVSGAAARAEMKAATENVEFSIDAARKVARMTGRPVTLHVDRRAEGSSAIGFSSPDSQLIDVSGMIPQYRFPEDIHLESDRETYRFDDRGLVEIPGQLVLVSVVDETITSVVRIGP